MLDAISNAKLINKDTFDSNNKDIIKAMTDLDTSNLNSAKAYIDSKQWQKYKLTNDDGTRKWLGTLSSPIESLEPGLYECTIPANANTVNAPLDVNNSSYIAELNVTKGSNGRKQIIFIQNYTEDVWLKQFIQTAWIEVGPYLILNLTSPILVGLPLTLTNNVQAYSTAYTPQYKLVNNNGDITLKLKGAVKNLTTTGVTMPHYQVI